MGIVEIRGHHLKTIERALRRNESSSLRNTGEYDYSLYFKKDEVNYDPPFAQNSFRIYSSLFRENPPVRLTNSSDAICKAPCPYLMYEEGTECNNPWAGTGFNHTLEEITKMMKEGDLRTIKEFGFNLGDEVQFSEVLRHIIDRNRLFFGYENLEAFKQNLDKVFHPGIVALYRE